MADFKQNYFQKRTKPKGPRTNQRITSQDVQVIASDGDNLGILNLQDAISRAKDQGLDLVEVSVASMQDGKISAKERSALMKKFWALVKALETSAKK